jgi:hypothetical protein
MVVLLKLLEPEEPLIIPPSEIVMIMPFHAYDPTNGLDSGRAASAGTAGAKTNAAANAIVDRHFIMVFLLADRPL